MLISVCGYTWEWDRSLYSGSAAYYPRGRLSYPKAFVEALATELRLDGSGRLLDVGCGPGSLTLLLAEVFEQAIGLDADRDMIDQAGRLAAQAGTHNARWLHMRAEDLPAGLGSFRLVTFAQSFHWMDRPRLAGVVRGMLDDGGARAHIHATTLRESRATSSCHTRVHHTRRSRSWCVSTSARCDVLRRRLGQINPVQARSLSPPRPSGLVQEGPHDDSAGIRSSANPRPRPVELDQRGLNEILGQMPVAAHQIRSATKKSSQRADIGDELVRSALVDLHTPIRPAGGSCQRLDGASDHSVVAVPSHTIPFRHAES